MPNFSLAGNDGHDFMCNICLEPWMEPSELVPCGHVFCSRCVKKLKNMKCPTCRTGFKSTQPPNRILVNQAKAVIVKCDSCSWVGSRELSVNHETECLGDPEGARVAREARAEAQQQQQTAAAAARSEQGGSKGFAGIFDYL